MGQVKGVPPPKISLIQFSKSVSGVNENVVATYLLDMKFEGYFTFYDAPNDQLVEITNPGIAAFIGKHLLKKNTEFFWKAAMNIFITLANVAVAITAIWALTKEPSELQKLEERLKKLEQGQYKEQVIANPNNQQTQNSGQSMLKNDSTMTTLPDTTPKQ